MDDASHFGTILIAGFGSAGRRHFRNLRELGCKSFVFLRSGCGILDSTEIQQFPAANTIAEALEYRPKIAVIATPTALHVETAIAAAEARCDLYIEKPLSHSLDGINRLRVTVENHQLIALIGCQFRFHPLLEKLQIGLKQGVLGTVIGAMAEWGEYLPSWHPWEDYRQSYSARPDLGGGVVLTLIHPLDYLYMLFGTPSRVSGTTSRVTSLETPAGEDWCDIDILFESGILGHIHLDYIQRPPVHRLSVIGEAGRADCDFNGGLLTWHLANGKTTVDRVSKDFQRNTMFLDAMRHFLDCVAQRNQSRVPLSDGEQVLMMALAAKRGLV